MKLSNEAYTPAYFIDPIREFANGFDFDPFSCDDANQIIKAREYGDVGLFSAYADCNDRLWLGSKKLWINPPYSTKELKQAINKVIEFKEGKEIYLLLNTDKACKT